MLQWIVCNSIITPHAIIMIELGIFIKLMSYELVPGDLCDFILGAVFSNMIA